ncbi:MAG TPA: adenylosuccinate lyase family protein [Candidatus Dormibacteraeota bacterium]|nr:adenylosuccinate lyase family protein [Candidatus Dormibacteraeota bacterium]
MVTRLTESALYRHLWSCPELDAVFEERARLQAWLDILIALALAQAEHGIIPESSAAAIALGARVDALDLPFVAEETRRSGHSTVGLIRGLMRVLPPSAREHVYYGATVQDLTDTWTSLAMKAVGSFAWRELREIESTLLALAELHRDTPMLGRTHGQPGSPITFGFKAASWADEIRRHMERLRQGAPRWLVGQLAGAVGTLAFFGESGLAVRASFCRRLGLMEPGVSWLVSRDRIAEFVHLLAMLTATLARIGTEVYELQRPEIGELRERSRPDAVGSITMPHKRNPEVAEHLVTLSRLVRAQAGVVLEGMVQEHERDGRGWKAEWAAFPESCLLSGASLSLGADMIRGLEVVAGRMRQNLEASGYSASERLLATLAPRLGKHEAQQLLQELLVGASQRGQSLSEALAADDRLGGQLARLDVSEVLQHSDTGFSGAMADAVVAHARAARSQESDEWP